MRLQPPFWILALLFGFLAVWFLPLATPAEAQEDCRQRWTVGGRGDGPVWTKPDGYRVGMKKMQALQLRRVGLRSSLAQDTWQFVMPGVRVVLNFEKNRLASGGLIIESQDYQEVYDDLLEQLGQPEEFGIDFARWRSEACDTVKMVQREGNHVAMLVQSLDYNARRHKAKKGR